MTPKPRPARRGYVFLLILAGVIYLTGMESLHWSFARVTLVASGGVLLCAAAQLRHRGVNREIRRRR